MYTRYSKIFLVWAIAFFTSLVVFNNITDYGSNYAFVSHVLKMDTTFPDNNGMWRSIDSVFLYHTVYFIIIFIETSIAALCWTGGFQLLKAVKNIDDFNKAKSIAIFGLTLGIFLWFTVFISIAGEWFLMWQSKVWNGQTPAFRLTVIFGMVLFYLSVIDTEKNT